MRTKRTAAALLAAALMCGCGAVVRPATRAGVGEALSTLATRESGETVGQILSDPAIQAAAAELVRVLVSAAADELSEERRLAMIEDAIADYVTRMSDILGRQMHALGLAMTARLDELVREVGSNLGSPETQNTIGDYVAALTRVMVGAATRQAEEDVPPAMTRMLGDPEVQAALHETGRVVAQGMVLGVDEGLEARARHVEQGGHSFLLTRLERLTRRGESVTGQLSWVTYVGSAAVAFIIALLLWQLRRTRRQARRRESALSALTKAIRRTEGRPWSPELHEALREHFRDGEPGSEYLRELLREHEATASGPSEPGPRPPHPGGLSGAPSTG